MATKPPDRRQQLRSGGRPARRWSRGLRSALDPRPWIHLARLAHFYNYSHLAPLRAANIGPGAAIAPNVSLRNGERVTIGEGARIGAYSSLWAGPITGRISVGREALLGPEVFMTAANYRTDAGPPVLAQGSIEADVFIGPGSWLGARVIVLPGVTVGAGAVVGAGSVVTRSVPDNAIAVGVPAKVVGSR